MWHTVPNPNWKYKTFYDHCTSGASLRPKVTISGDIYTFVGGNGIVLIKHLRGKPKDHPVLVCNLPMGDSVTATVTSP